MQVGLTKAHFLSVDGATVGRLEDGSDIRVYTLLDTGATKPILHKGFYERTPFMHTYPKYK